MRTITVLVLIWLSHAVLQAQEIIEKHISYSGKESVSLKIQIADTINIHMWNKDEVYVKASVNVNDNKDNAAYETSFDDTGKSVDIKANFRDKYFKGRNNCCNSEISWQVWLPEKSRFSVETIDGNVTVTGLTSEVKVKTISGYIDLAVPSNKKADLDFSTISGRMYSNLDFPMKTVHSGIPLKINEKLNDGGDPVRLETISGDIFFRKSK